MTVSGGVYAITEGHKNKYPEAQQNVQLLVANIHCNIVVIGGAILKMRMVQDIL